MQIAESRNAKTLQPAHMCALILASLQPQFKLCPAIAACFDALSAPDLLTLIHDLVRFGRCTKRRCDGSAWLLLVMAPCLPE